MYVHRKKKDSSQITPGSTQEQTATAQPEQQVFQQYPGELARGAIRMVLEGMMREKLDMLIMVSWGEISPKRNGYRNGSYTLDLVTISGGIEDLQVPRDREGQFRTSDVSTQQLYQRTPQ